MSKGEKKPALDAYEEDLKRRLEELKSQELRQFQSLGIVQGQKSECEKLLADLHRLKSAVMMEKALLASTPAEPPSNGPEAEPQQP